MAQQPLGSILLNNQPQQGKIESNPSSGNQLNSSPNNQSVTQAVQYFTNAPIG